MSNLTKKAIKTTFIELLNKLPLNQITVKMIVEECGINRNSFYYHYQDLPALIEEIIIDEMNRITSEYTTIDSIHTALHAVLDFASQNRKAILHIYNSVNRDIVERYLWQICDYVVKEYGKSIPGDQKGKEEDMEIIRHFYLCECFGVVINWLSSGMPTDIDAKIERFCELHQGMLEETIRRSLNTK